jgi:predicted DNA-binding transcriptional regulator AlpA
MPVEDRAADTWEPLIAVADHAGRDWPDLARNAVLQLLEEATETAETADRIRLLLDIHAAFGDLDAIPTALLLQRLKADPEAPWIGYGHTGLSPRKLGILLAEYDIRSATIRFSESGQAKGFYRTDFHDAWRRYCPDLPATSNDSTDETDGHAATTGTDRPDIGGAPPVPPVPTLISAGQPCYGWYGSSPPPGRGRPMTKPDDRLTLAEVCAELRISRSTFYEWRTKGRAPRCIKLPNGDLRIRRSEFERWLDSCEEAA